MSTQSNSNSNAPFNKLGFWDKVWVCFRFSKNLIFTKKHEKAIQTLLECHASSPLNIFTRGQPVKHGFRVHEDHVFTFACQTGLLQKFGPDYFEFLKDREARRASGNIHTIGAILVELDEQGLSVYWKPGQIPQGCFPPVNPEKPSVHNSLLDPSPRNPSTEKSGDFGEQPNQKSSGESGADSLIKGHEIKGGSGHE